MKDCDNAADAANILCIQGQQAQSDFKIKQLKASMQFLLPELKSIQAHFCYFVLLESVISPEEIRKVLQLIDGENDLLFNPLQSNSILVVPRFGTISAWSSKATDIVGRCGIQCIKRIERGTHWELKSTYPIDSNHREIVYPNLQDRMIESVLTDVSQIQMIFDQGSRRQVQEFDVLSSGMDQLAIVNDQLGLALTQPELSYVRDWFEKEKRNPTDAELMMFSQVNSEHCRHKIFNASWEIDGKNYPHSMFSMIRETHRMNPTGTLVAYNDNASVIEGNLSTRFASFNSDGKYEYSSEPVHVIYKAETHNHPTAISPYPGAATGAGGEIRDEGATGRGGKPKAGLCGFSVSHLHVPEFIQPWEEEQRYPQRISSPLQIMLEAPIGSASFNNEFGRPNIGGYFRTFETSNRSRNSWYGYHKPIMFAGGIGNIRPSQIEKRELAPGDLLFVIGGPAMLIGLGGGAASSLGQGRSGEELDYASVQRSNPEMQRRCQEVIDRCCELDEGNPILFIHDVGAGGLSNALPEIVHASNLGARIDLNQIPNDEPSMSPMEIWCNEAQERYVLAISRKNVSQFSEICERERCPYAVVGEVSSDRIFQVIDSQSENLLQKTPVNVDMEFLMGGFKRITRQDHRIQMRVEEEVASNKLQFAQCVERVLRFPSVADKSFLITIGDRTVSGLIHRDQMVGPWQVPVADAAVTMSGYNSFTGEAMAVGERSPIAITNAPASARMAIGEALTNLRSASVPSLKQVKLSANWMAAANIQGQGSDLYESVRSIALDLCKELGTSIPVGKDSLSMSTEWNEDDGTGCKVWSPISLIVSAFTSVVDVRNSLTPQLQDKPDTTLLLVDLGDGRNRMGMSVLYQTINQITGIVPDIDFSANLKSFFDVVGELIELGYALAYHDRSDGGLFSTLCEMAFAGHTGLDIRIDQQAEPINYLFNEELGAVIQIETKHLLEVLDLFADKGISNLVHEIGTLNNDDKIKISMNGSLVYENSRVNLHRLWSELSWRMQSLRDNPKCALQEYDRIQDGEDLGLAGNNPDALRQFWNSNSELLRVFPGSQLNSSQVNSGAKPRVAILREQGVNGHVEMAAAFDRAGFDAYDVVMADLLAGDTDLDQFNGLAMCGGFSFGDVFGAGRGWAGSILYQNKLRDMFEAFFADTQKFALGVCNGCQVMAELKSIIPGSENWPKFVRNESQQFEARLVMVEVSSSNSILTSGFQQHFLPVPVAHGEGNAKFPKKSQISDLHSNSQICLRYVDNREQVTNQYPYNPNGSDSAVAGVTNLDGRITAMMPHPERAFRTAQHSWAPQYWGEDSLWLHLFKNAKYWLE